jgi:hypothetical protein
LGYASWFFPVWEASPNLKSSLRKADSSVRKTVGNVKLLNHFR